MGGYTWVQCILCSRICCKTRANVTTWRNTYEEELESVKIRLMKKRAKVYDQATYHLKECNSYCPGV
jgi:Fe-S-cluster containining protein